MAARRSAAASRQPTLRNAPEVEETWQEWLKRQNRPVKPERSNAARTVPLVPVKAGA